MLAFCAAGAGSAEGLPWRIALPESPSRVVRHAADELSKYLKRMTGSSVAIGSDSVGKSGAVFVLGGPETNPLAGRLLASGALTEPAQWADEKSPDAYYLRCARVDGVEHVVLGGKSDVAVLYAVYEYLQRYGGCGFFEDGDFVPRRQPQTSDVDFLTRPRFSVREFHGDICGSFGLKKYHYLHRTMDDWIPFYDWLAKRRINLSGVGVGVNSATAGKALEMAFGIKDDQPGERYGGGWPTGWTWPAEERTRIARKRLAYQRSLGIKNLMGFMFGQTPVPFKKAHPELKWVEVSYEHALLHPDEPLAYELTKKFYQACVDLYGSDHFFWDTPYSECPGAADWEESLKLKTDAANKACRIFRDIDPRATWFCDSWDFGALPGLWTPDRVRRFFEAIPREMAFFFDTTTELDPHYKQTEYFHGVGWGVGILHSFQGDDHLHGDIAGTIRAIQQAANDPRSTELTGFFNGGEIHGHNPLYRQLATELEWNPDGITTEGFLDYFTLRRYGQGSYKVMRKAVDALARAVYSGQNVQPMYHKIGCFYMPHAWPIVDDSYQHASMQMPGLPSSIAGLGQALRTALGEEGRQSENPLYENDMVDWSKSYLMHLFNYSTIRAYEALREGKPDEVRKRCESARAALIWIERILSTRPDFSLQQTIDQAMSIPGTNPSTPRMIRQHCVNDLYATNDNYEQMRLFYRPRAEIYLSAIEERSRKGKKGIRWTDISEECEQIRARWLDGPIAIPDSEHFKGSTMDAVRGAMKAASAIERSVSLTSRSRTLRASLSVACAEKPVSKGLRIVECEDGAGKTEDFGGTLCWTAGSGSVSASPFLYVAADHNAVFDTRQSVAVTVEFCDAGSGQIEFQYDSNDPSATMNGAYKVVPAFTLSGTNQWRSETVTVPDARFAGRQNGSADFRLAASGEAILRVRRISVAPAASSPDLRESANVKEGRD